MERMDIKRKGWRREAGRNITKDKEREKKGPMPEYTYRSFLEHSLVRWRDVQMASAPFRLNIKRNTSQKTQALQTQRSALMIR